MLPRPDEKGDETQRDLAALRKVAAPEHNPQSATRCATDDHAATKSVTLAIVGVGHMPPEPMPR
jgi:hypothetical protein